MAEHGLTQQVLDDTDVLIWWGHKAHQEVSDAVVQRVYDRVMEGMGLIVLHSGHASKIFRKVCGTDSWRLKWREDGETELLWNVAPGHEITRGIDDYIRIPQEEMYGEPFGIPAPDELVFISWFEGGEVFRSGVCYHRGRGRVFYFRPGHEAFPVYHMPEIQRIIVNACHGCQSAGVWPENGGASGTDHRIRRHLSGDGDSPQQLSEHSCLHDQL